MTQSEFSFFDPANEERRMEIAPRVFSNRDICTALSVSRGAVSSIRDADLNPKRRRELNQKLIMYKTYLEKDLGLPASAALLSASYIIRAEEERFSGSISAVKTNDQPTRDLVFAHYYDLSSGVLASADSIFQLPYTYSSGESETSVLELFSTLSGGLKANRPIPGILPVSFRNLVLLGFEDALYTYLAMYPIAEAFINGQATGEGE